MTDLIASEFLKLRTTKTVWALLGATVALTALAVAGAVIVGADSSTVDLESAEGVRTVLHVSASGAIFVLVLGIVLAAGEYRQGTAVDTFLTTPQRWRVVVAKVTTATVAGLGFGALSAGVALAVANHVYELKGYSFPLDSSQAWTILAGAVGYAALFGAIGAATGSLVRNQVGAIVGWLAWAFVAESIVVQIVSSIGRWFPAVAGRALVRDPTDGLLSQRAAAVVLTLYAVTIAAAAITTERHRDA